MIVADALALCYRAHHGSKGTVSDARGFDTGATEIVRRNLEELVTLAAGAAVHLAWDCPGVPTFRHDLFPGYKSHRNPMPEALAGQLRGIRAAAEELGVRQWIAPGFEADDIMATLAAFFAPERVLVFSPDKDMLQLVDERVTCAWFGRGEERFTLMDAAAVRAKHGVEPRQIPLLLALMGDACDGLPGMPGIGPKRAAALCKNGWKESPDVLLGVKMATLRTDATLESL